MNSFVFIGSSIYGIPALDLLIKQGFAPKLVISQPDKPAGRKQLFCPTPVSEYARKAGLKLLTPEKINVPEVVNYITELNPDIIITASYGGYIGKQIRRLATRRVINLHPSLLPKYRGASPIQSVLLNGEASTGTSIYRLISELDAGPIIAQRSLDILPEDNYSSLQSRLAQQAAEMLMDLMKTDSSTPFAETPQDHKMASLCPKIDSSTCMINWQVPASAVLNKIRAFSYIPGAWVYFRRAKLKIMEAQVTDHPVEGEHGCIARIIKNIGFTVNCLDKQLLITSVQAEGKKIMTAGAYVNGARLSTGEQLWM